MIKKTFAKGLNGLNTFADIYTVPTSKKSEFRLLYITDTAGNGINVDVQYVPNGGTAIDLLKDYSISQKEFVQIGGGEYEFINMNAGDVIKARASGFATIIISVIESNDIIQGG